MSFLVRKSGFLVALLAIAACALIAFRGPQGVNALMEKRREIRDLQEQNADLARENQLMRERISRLQSSRAEQELEIRNRLKLVRPGDTTFVLPEPAKTEPESTPKNQ